MGKSVLELAVNTGQWDAGLKKASSSLHNFIDTSGGLKQAMDKDSESLNKFVQMIGNMDSKAKTSRSQMNDYKKMFEDLRTVFNQLSDAEKNSTFGQSLQASMDKVKAKFQEAQRQMNETNKALTDTNSASSNASGGLDKLTGALGINIKQLAGWGTAIAAGKAALSVIKDAFFASESSVDEWGRTVAAGKSIYEGFLQALNSGNLSGFFNNMDNIISKARAAYDALDTLNTMMTIINPERVKLQARANQIKGQMRRGEISQEAGQQALRENEKELSKAYRMEAGMNYNAFTKEVQRKLATAGETLTDSQFSMLMRSFHDSDFAMQMRNQAKGSRNTRVTYMGTTQNGQGMYRTETSDTRNLQQRMMDLFTDEWRQQFSPYLSASFSAINSSNQMLLGDARYLKGGGGGGGGTIRTGGGGGGGGTVSTPPPTGSIVEQEAKVQALTKAWREATDQAGRDGYLKQLEEAKAVLDEMQGKKGAPAGSMAELEEELNKLTQAQRLATSPEEWKRLGDEIDGVKKRMSTLRGEVEEMATGLAGVSQNSLSAWISGQSSSMGNMEMGSSGYLATRANIIDAKTMQNVLENAIKNDIAISPDTIESLWEQIIGGENIPDEVWQELIDTINDQLAELDIQPIKIDFETGEVHQKSKQMKQDWKDAAKAIQSVGSAMTSIENPMAKVVGTIAQAIASIALGAGEAIKQAGNGSAGGPWGWIAFAAAATATMISSIAAVKSATSGGFAEGGIVPGNYNSGDQLRLGDFGVNSGELILNRAQQGNLASQLSGGVGDLNLSAVVTAEDIVFVLNNRGKRTGRGEYLMTH